MQLTHKVCRIRTHSKFQSEILMFSSVGCRGHFLIHQGTNIGVHHIFSCELDEQKRNVILMDHPEIQHCFGDVNAFSKGKGYCYKCSKEHNITQETCSVHIFLGGPSCKNLSKLCNLTKVHSGCYQRPVHEQFGESGYTYRHGWKAEPRVCFRSVFIFVVFIYGPDFFPTVEPGHDRNQQLV